MQQPDTPQMSFRDLVDILLAVSIRSGDLGVSTRMNDDGSGKAVLVLDRIADLPPADRAMHAAMLMRDAARVDPVVANVLSNMQAVPVMRSEILRRRSLP